MRPPECEIFILAGGLSTRMGRDKSRVRLGHQTLLQHIRAAASQLPYPVRSIRRDAVPRCGPIGGIYTALKRSRADAILLLACDMPFISPGFLKKMIKTFQLAPPAKKLGVSGRAPGLPIALFAHENKLAGFPCLLRREAALPIVSAQIAVSQFSLQALAKKLRAKTLSPPRAAAAIQLTNINTPADLQKAARRANI